MLLYPDHIQNWLDYGCSLVIFLILVLFWLSETGQIWGFQAFSEKPIEEMAWNFACWYILTTFRTGVSRHFGRALWIFLIVVTLWLNLSYLGFLGIIWRAYGSKCRGEGGGIFPTLCVQCCLVWWHFLLSRVWFWPIFRSQRYDFGPRSPYWAKGMVVKTQAAHPGQNFLEYPSTQLLNALGNW